MTGKILFILLFISTFYHPVILRGNNSWTETKVNVCKDSRNGICLKADYVIGENNGKRNSSFETLLSLNSVNKDLFALLICLNRTQERNYIILISDNGIFQDSIKQNIRFFTGDTLRTYFTYDDVMHTAVLRYSVGNGTFADSIASYNMKMNLNIQYYARSGKNSTLKCLQIGNIFEREKDWKYKTFAWLLAIILIDIILFVWIQIKRKKSRRLEKQSEEQNETGKQKAESENMIHTGEIITFGGLQVFDKGGVNVVKKLSPIMKEILLMLICYSSKKGISSDEMKNLLWYDKDQVSARNNRSVYFTKLRTFLEQLGGYELKQENGRWVLTFDDIKLDLLRFYEIVTDGSASKNDIYELLGLMQNGPFLSFCNYEWLDKFREETTDLAIQLLSTYAGQINLKDDPIFVVQIADTLFKLDSLSEVALIYKCKALKELSKHNQAKQLYNSFVKEYHILYGECFEKSFSSIMLDEQTI